MKGLNIKSLFGVALLGVALVGSVHADTPPIKGLGAQPGTLNYVEGQARVGEQDLNGNSVGSVTLQPGQSLATENGRAEILLTPGVVLRVAHDSSVTMVSPDLINTEVQIDKGESLVKVNDLHKENNLRVQEGGATATLKKNGLYDFDANEDQIRVFDGKAEVRRGSEKVDVTKNHEVTLSANAELKSKGFDADKSQDDFYKWSRLRSEYMAEANAWAAETFVGDGPWYGGWYWNPWFDGYVFFPANGIVYSPFGWGFYSPWAFRGFYGYPYWGVRRPLVGPRPPVVPRSGPIRTWHGAGRISGGRVR